MTAVRLRPRAEADLVERTRYYRREAGTEVGRDFFDAAIAVLDAIGRLPGAGTPRVGELCGIPGLRYRRVPGYPCGWFYFIVPGGVDVIRLLADAQDLPAGLAHLDAIAEPGDSAGGEPGDAVNHLIHPQQ